MSKTLYATWLDGDNDQIAEYMGVLRKVPGVGNTAVYQPRPRSERMQVMQGLVSRLDAPEMGTAKAWMLAELEAPVVGLTITEQVGPHPSGAPVDGPARIVVNQQLLHEMSYVPGVEETEERQFAPAVQFGILSTRSVETEWKLLDWYERLRLLVVQDVPGMIRTRRYVSIAGIAKFAILYEFLSVQARHDGFEEHHEWRGADPHNPWNLREFALHCPGAPFVGERLDI